MLEPEYMSVAEKQFIRIYVAALRRDFNLLESVMALMHPDGLAIDDVMQAVAVATELQHMQAEFDKTLHNLPTTHKFSRKTKPGGPSLDTLADLFALSFFKVFTVLESKKPWPKKQDAGWFSGKPAEWHQLFKQLEAASDKSEKKQSPIFNTFAKFFPQLSLFKNFHLAQPTEESTTNSWPSDHYGSGLTKNKSAEYEEEDYYDDEDEDDDIGSHN